MTMIKMDDGYLINIVYHNGCVHLFDHILDDEYYPVAILEIQINYWKKIYRADGRIEWGCKHGCGHPDIREKVYPPYTWERIKDWVAIHGCDGCCSRDDFPGSK